MPSDAENIGRRIGEIRRERGRSTQSIATEAGLSRASVARIEAGRANPVLDSLARIASALGVPTSAFFTTPSDRPPGEVPWSSLESRAYGRTDQVLRDPKFAVPRQSEVALMNVELGTEAMWTEPGLYWRLDLPPVDPPDGLPQQVVICVGGRQPGDEPYDMVEHPQDELLIVLDGCLDVAVGPRTYRLQEGDAIHLAGAKPHQWNLVGDRPARLVQIILPPVQRQSYDPAGHAWTSEGPR